MYGLIVNSITIGFVDSSSIILVLREREYQSKISDPDWKGVFCNRNTSVSIMLTPCLVSLNLVFCTNQDFGYR